MEIFIFILGMCAGSFVNMLIYRTAGRYKLERQRRPQGPPGEQRKRSFCDFCGRQLKWYENIPVVSWVIQGGRSRCCGKKLPVAYPITELGMGILFWLNFWVLGQGNSLSVEVIVGWLVITGLVFAGLFDIKYMILPDFSTAVLIGAAVLEMAAEGQAEGLLVQKIGAAAGGVGFLWLLYLATRGKGMGFGDVKLAVFMGLWLGWPKILLAFWLAFVAGGLLGLGLMTAGKLKRKSVIAFGPFLIGATLVTWWWGEKIISNLGVFNLQ